MTDTEFYLGIRQAVLSALDVFERWLISRDILRPSARTAELRKQLKAIRKECDEQA